MDWNAIWTSIVNWAVSSGVKIVISFILLVVSFTLINRLSKYMRKKVDEKDVDKTVSLVIIKLVKIGLKVLVVLVLLGYLGLETGSITALIASLGVGIGLATQGALSNIAGGILLLVTRPFKVDDFIQTNGESGTVEEISIIYTRICTPDNKVVLIPNGTLANANIVNFSVKDLRRVDFTFGISYASDFVKAQNVILEVFARHKLVLKDPEPMVRVTEHAASSVNLASRCWVKSADYWTVYFDVMEEVKAEFDKQGIKIPYNQIDIHIDQKK